MFDKSILSQRVAENIKQMILDKDYHPGDKLPNEIEMTQMVNVSRSTIREAIKILVSTNILEVRRGKGTYVSEKPGLTKDPLGMDFISEDRLLMDLFEIRLLLEPEMTKLAVERGLPTDFDKIFETYERVAEQIKAGKNHTEADIAFHTAIADASHNIIMNRIVPLINEGIVGGYLKTKDNPESAEEVLRQHEKIVDFIKKREPQKAKKAMQDHILYGLQGFKSYN
ncbi:FadR family transcriptional regulator [Petrocella atlantisensis]|jgi:DNA-binding FadR family transcriptional regulator|uniref:FadR family transcriptional regulator n=1 Tax=Petrocella atlantisensis TaxID=2173034 RepID=A0A3P7RUP0_9FIRM|nr:FadR/GntR family transcriptional regulator [Petrocella atlantisensis]MCF8018044.1 FadR family transcriptional regulator [Vallitaleaceae bacterium]VDN46516.1 FadR family transcriptional regulator [Petrocella atlantisensis]